MIYLFVHQNFPGQYKHLVRHLADQPENSVYFITQPNQNWMAGVTKLVYQRDIPPQLNCHPYTVEIDLAMRVGLSVAEVCRDLKSQRILPDVIIGHAGWGEMLFVKDVFPNIPVLSYFEFYYHFSQVDLGFDPEFPSRPDDAFRLRMRNTISLLSFDSADWGTAPTRWQRSVHPPEFRPRISMVHEGVDTDLLKPDPKATISLARDGLQLTREDEVITYVARNLEPYRGFHIFMRALPDILRRRPQAHIVLVGGDGVSYGAAAPQGMSYREIMLHEVGGELDMSRVHFLGRIPYEAFISLLQVSSAHVYLTYPFVLSWSFLEAMACGCAMIGSATPPVMEVLEDGHNGLAVDFFSPKDIADRVDAILDHPDRMQAMRDAARRTVVEKYDLRSRQLPAWLDLIDCLINRRRPSVEEG
jgi:glycosyltransferase involved in cell wall biosynthesis